MVQIKIRVLHPGQTMWESRGEGGRETDREMPLSAGGARVLRVEGVVQESYLCWRLKNSPQLMLLL